MRYRVYRLLIEGDKTMAAAAKRLKVSSQAVEGHVRKLLGIGAIQRQPGGKRPYYYQKGPNWAAFVAHVESQVFERPGRSERVAPLVERIHGDQYRFEVIGGPEREPEWRYVSTAKRVEQREYVVPVNGVDFVFRDYNGPRRRTIMLEPGSEYNMDPKKAEEVKERRKTVAEVVGLQFAHKYGFRFAPMVIRREPESGSRADVKPFGNPNVDLVYADKSPATEGLAEIEWKAQAARAGATFLAQPQTNAENERRWRDHEEWKKLVRAELDDLKSVTLEVVETERAVLEAGRVLRPKAGLPRPLDYDPGVM